MAKEVKMVCECGTRVPCCVALETEPIDEDRAIEAARAFSALGDPHRVAIIHLIAATGKTALLDAFARRAMEAHPHLLVARGNCNDYSGMGDPYLPFRDVMAMLSGDVENRWDTGVITRERRGRWSYYDLVDGRISFLVDTLTAYQPAAAA